MNLRLLPALVVAALALAGAVAGCGSSNDSSSSTGTNSATAPAAQTTDTTAPAQTTAPPPARFKAPGPISADLKKKPRVPKPKGSPPDTLVVKDIVKGTGATAQAGDTVTVQYVGVSFSNGKQFDASWDRGQPFAFPLGAGRVIPGWDQGVAGMKVGGRRELVIPPQLGYGEQGSPPVILGNETLVFIVDLKKVTR
jgi:peptidylprolyl isomerase